MADEHAETTAPADPGPIGAAPAHTFHPIARVLVWILRAAVAPERATLDIVGIALIAVGLGLAIGVGWAFVAAGAALILLRLAQVPPPDGSSTSP